MLNKNDYRYYEIIHSMEAFFDYVSEDDDHRLTDILDEYLKDHDFPEKEDDDWNGEGYRDAVQHWYDNFVEHCTDIAKSWE